MFQQVAAQKSPDYLERFLSYCQYANYRAKATMVNPGTPADTLYYIVEGSVSIILNDEDGHEMILAYGNAGEFLGEMGVFVPQPERNVIIRTRVPCKIAKISYQKFHELIAGPLAGESKELLLLLGEQISRRLMHSHVKVRHMTFLDAAEHILKTLKNLCKEPDAITHPDGMQIKITRQDIGKMVGCSRETAGRMLKLLEEGGEIAVSGKTIVVHGTR